MEHECWLYVNKQGPSSRQWKKRWVGWNENNQSLEYRKQPGDRSATAIGIGKVDSISASSVCHHRKTDTSHPSTGFIVAADRVYYFSCETLDDREKWIEFLWRKRNVYISLGSTDSQQRPSNLSLTGSGHDYPTQSLEQSNAGHVLANLPPLMPVLLNEAMATQAPKIQITPRSEGEAAPLSPHTSHRQAMDDESKRASWSPMSSHEIDQLKKEKDQLEIDLKSLRDKFDTVSEKYRLETKRLGVPQYGTERRKNTSESAPNTLKYKSTVRKSILPGANNPYENNNSGNNNATSNNGQEDIPEEDEVEEGFMDLDKLINNEDYDSPRGASGANSVPDAVAASPREYPPPRQAMSPDSILDRRRMHKGHSKSDEFNRSAASTINQRNGPEELKNIDFSKFGYYAKNKTAEEIVLDLLSENKTLKERKRKAENDLSLLQLKYNEDLRKIVEYDHIIEKLNDEKSKLREQTNKLKTDRANFEKEKEAMNNNSNVNNTNPNNPPGTIKSPRTRSGSGDKSAKNKEDGQKKVTKKQLLKDLETVTKQLEQLTSEYETTKTQWLQQEKKRVEDEKNKPQSKERAETVDNGSTSPELPTFTNALSKKLNLEVGSASGEGSNNPSVGFFALFGKMTEMIKHKIKQWLSYFSLWKTVVNILQQMSINDIEIRDIQEADDLSSATQIIIDAFAGELDKDAAEYFINSLRKFGIIAIHKPSAEIIGINFLSTNEDDTRAVGPIAVRPDKFQGLGIGRLLMEKIIEKAEKEGAKRITLVQDASNMISLSLYLKLGFKLTAHCGEFKGLVRSTKPIRKDLIIRPMALNDVSKVSKTWLQACGYTREVGIIQTINGTTNETPASSRPFVIFHGEECVGFTLGLNFMSSTLVKDISVYKALLRYVSNLCNPNDPSDIPQFIVPLQYSDAVEWMLKKKMRLLKTFNQMVYQDQSSTVPRGGWIFVPSGGGC